jgi:hypothetical protein
MSTTASTQAVPGADFERAARQALRLVTPARLRLVAVRPRRTATAVPPADADVEALAISVGVLSPVDTGPR